MTTSELLDDLLAYVRSEKRVCPNPQEWHQLWEMLPDKKRVGQGREPPLPLILDAWWDTPALSKMVRLEEHIRYAYQHGVLEQVDAFLRQLKPEQWFYL